MYHDLQETKYLENFGISDARRYFEKNATDLSPLRFTEKVQTKSSDLPDIELIPEWDKALQASNHEVSLIEVPIRSNSIQICVINVIRNGQRILRENLLSQRRLVIARRDSSKTDMFVITLIPSLKSGGNVLKSMENFRYLSGSDFTGRVFCSTLEGRFVEACQYVNGCRIGLLRVTTIRHLEERGIDPGSESYESIALSNGVKTKSGTYSFIEEPCSVHGQCEFHPQYSACNCPFCLDEVIVTACQLCGAKLEEGEICNCRCAWCGQYPCQCCLWCNNYPCICGSSCMQCRPGPCSACPRCGSHYCYGTCGSGGGGITPPPVDPDLQEIPDPCDGLKFNGIMVKILGHEGGYVNDPDDPGKATNKGIAWGTWQRYAKSTLGIEPTLENLKNLTDDQANSIYQSAFWKKAKIDDIQDPDMRYAFFDFYINAGTNATKVLQTLLNELQSDVTLVVDGAIGSKTIDCLNSIDHKKLYNMFLENRRGYYENLASKKPKLAKFLNGWLNRVNTFNQKTDVNRYNINC